MYLTDISSSFPSFSPFKKHSNSKSSSSSSSSSSLPNKFDLISRSFDEALLRRLKNLSSPPPPSPSSMISLAWLSNAVDLLSVVHSDARRLVASVQVVGTEIDDEYVDDSVKLLDVCNAVTAEIERLRHRRLMLAFAVQLLGEGNVRRAKDVLKKKEEDGGRRRVDSAEALVKDLAVSVRAYAPPLQRGGKVNNVGRLVRWTMHAVGLVTVFVAGVMVSAMNGASVVTTVEAPSAEYSWVVALNELAAEVSGELKKRRRGGGVMMMLEEEEVETRVREACEAMEEGENDVIVIKEAEKAMVSFSDGLEELSKRVNEMFHGVLCNRNHMLDNFRV